jgi:hypothetical protein
MMPVFSFSVCRSLLAGDERRGRSQNRLQAGSYIPTKPKQASGYQTQEQMNALPFKPSG